MLGKPRYMHMLSYQHKEGMVSQEQVRSSLTLTSEYIILVLFIENWL
jgi:hypothetical protein